MSDDKTDFDISPPINGENGNGEGEAKQSPDFDAFENLIAKLKLREEDITSPATVRLLYQDKRRLQKELTSARKNELLYYSTHAKKLVLKEKLKAARESSIWSSVSLIAGGVLIGQGARAGNWFTGEYDIDAIVMVGVGCVLLLAAIVIQFLGKKKNGN